MGRGIWFLILSVFVSNSLKAQSPSPEIIPFEPEVNLSFNSNQILCDSTGNLTVYDIENGALDDQFKPLWKYSDLEENRDYWIRFTLNTGSDRNGSLVRIRPKFRKADLYFRNDSGQMVVQKNGLNERFSERIIPDPDIMLLIPPGSGDKTFYLNVRADYKTGLGLNNEPITAYISESLDKSYARGFFFGIGAIAFLFSFIFFFKLKEKTYLFYSLYVLSFTIFAFVDMGLIVRAISSTGIPWHRDLYTVPFASMTVFLLFYARGLLETHKNPFLDKLILTSIYARIFIYLIGTIFNIPAFYSPR
jgi:hypothetical protein